jgi:hypothetical protein
MPLSLSSVVLVVVLSGLFWQEPAAQKTVTNQVVAYDSIRERLIKETKVPLHLPAFIPFTGDSSNPVFAILDSTDMGRYEIQLAWSADCNGGNWCHLGSIQGSTDPISIEGRKIPVSLRGGVKGYFVSSRCYAYCTDATILWSQDGAHYSIGIKAGDEKLLLKMANSAIR